MIRALGSEEGRGLANAELGVLDERRADLIVRAADESSTAPSTITSARRLADRQRHPDQHERQRVIATRDLARRGVLGSKDRSTQ